MLKSNYFIQLEEDMAPGKKGDGYDRWLSGMTDTERIDWLESYINENGAILLHDGSASNFGSYSGIGLRPGYVNRTLRQAIDDCGGRSNINRFDKVR